MGLKTLHEYFYKLAYGDKGADKATLVNDCLDVADAAIKANLDAFAGKQPLDAGLTSIAGLTTAADKIIYATALDTYAVTSLTAFARSILDDADEATFKATVNLEIGIDVAAAGTNADITSLTALTGGQITFPATQVPSAGANVLDDYEEGTWTAVIQGSGTAGTYEIASQNSNYTKIGRVVHLESEIIMAASITGGGTNYLKITGCPFAKMANSNPTGIVHTSGIDLTGLYLAAIFGSSGATSNLYVVEIKDDATSTFLPISAIAANDTLAFSLTYFE